MRVFGVFLLLWVSCSGYKFLVYNPKFGRSQVMFLGKIADILAQGNHTVINYVTDISSSFNDTGSKIAETWFRPRKYVSDYDIGSFHIAAWLVDWSSLNVYGMFAEIGQEFRLSCEDQLNDTEFLHRLKEQNFDVGFSEYFDTCGFQIFKKIGIKKHILVYSSAMPQSDATWFGVPATPSITPDIGYGYTPEMTFFERVSNYLTYNFNMYLFLPALYETSKAYKNVYGEEFDHRKAFAESQYYFVNTDEHLDFPQLITHKRVHIGGLGMENGDLKADLPKDMEEQISKFKKGFILVSFGTVAASYAMPEGHKKAFLEAFQQFPEILFIWKYERDDDFGKEVRNLHKSTWVPQRSLLSHPRALAFLTHSGLNSVTEATNAGVPMINIPLFADQMYNSAMALTKGIGYRVDKFGISKDTLANAIRTVVDDPGYKRRSKELSRMIRAKPMGPDERIRKYSEFAAEFDVASNLDIHGRDVNFFVFYSLDVIAFLLSIIAIAFYGIYRMITLIFRRQKRKTE
ncbi:unnamed protein product [Bursaphelenchus xylophilus]|uniref:glucuronosyltransferase n=1 Tax=Bursaphelenchus xylophilus TaxID=6326 RepID=A0A1I7RW62_BURXY|nr:unnamed protein product [Bursaphelenchus xylophilus]CAG9095181.1 unnamed protein product [Bursaphelenchus xylophilus]